MDLAVRRQPARRRRGRACSAAGPGRRPTSNMPASQAVPVPVLSSRSRRGEGPVQRLGVRREVGARLAEVAGERLGQHHQVGARRPAGRARRGRRGSRPGRGRRRAGRGARGAGRGGRDWSAMPPPCQPFGPSPKRSRRCQTARRGRTGDGRARGHRAHRRQRRPLPGRRQGLHRDRRASPCSSTSWGAGRGARGGRGRRRGAHQPSRGLRPRGPARRRPGRRTAGRPGRLPATRRASWSSSRSTCRWSPRRRSRRLLLSAEEDGALLVDEDGRRQYLCAVYRSRGAARGRPAARGAARAADAQPGLRAAAGRGPGARRGRPATSTPGTT